MNSKNYEGESNFLSFERLETLKSKQKLDNITSILYSTHQTNRSEKPSTKTIKRNEWDMEDSNVSAVSHEELQRWKEKFVYLRIESVTNK